MAVEPVRVPRAGASPTDGVIRALERWMTSLLTTLGTEVLGELGRFSRAAGPGAMITIRRTHDGFTAQVTGSIVGGRPEPLSLQAIHGLTTEVDRD